MLTTSPPPVVGHFDRQTWSYLTPLFGRAPSRVFSRTSARGRAPVAIAVGPSAWQAVLRGFVLAFVVTQRSRLSGTSLRGAAFVVLPNSESGVARLHRQSCVNACRPTAFHRQAARERFRAQLDCVFIGAREFAAGRLVTKSRPRVLAAFSIHGALRCRAPVPKSPPLLPPGSVPARVHRRRV